MKLTTEREDAFFAKVNKTDTCWFWTGSLTKAGYGSFGGFGRSTAYAVSYIHHKGPIPENSQLDHLCSNPSCVNPAHLEAVTFVENQARRKIRMRWRGWPTHCKVGHVMDDLNTFWRSNGTGRQCRRCLRKRQSESSVRKGGKAYGYGEVNGTLKNKHLYELTSEDYERANLSEWLIEVFFACDDMRRHGERETLMDHRKGTLAA